MSKHTPIPWETNYTGNIWGDIDNPEHDGDFPLLARVELWEASPHDEEAKANAVFICKAVNCHDEFLATCKRIVKWLDRLAKNADKQAECRFESLREASIADAKNFRATAADINKIIAKAEETP